MDNEGNPTDKLDVDQCFFKGMYVYKSEKEKLWGPLNELVGSYMVAKYPSLLLSEGEVENQMAR
jgi:hypothetical protein